VVVVPSAVNSNDELVTDWTVPWTLAEGPQPLKVCAVVDEPLGAAQTTTTEALSVAGRCSSP
jgi:hypothetical protein